jgi:hypothetical protein
MSLKKQPQVRTGKMVRELMLDDKDVTASLIMVYSNNGVNEEIKVEGLNPKSNEELFLSGNVDWNRSVIYKIVDFSGRAEVGKVVLDSMNKNNLILKIERIMWSKEKNGEKQEVQPKMQQETPQDEVAKQQEETKLTLVHKEVKQEQPVPKETAIEKPKTEPASFIDKKPASLKVPQHNVTPIPSKTDDHYQQLVSKAIAVCHDYDLGMDLDDSIEQLKEELQSQNVYVQLDKDVMDVVRRLRQLKEKGINLDSIYKLI